ncbi:hypothetical protein C1O12_25235 [Enterobacter hormaechei]|uniref:Uncharacterized protein n=1 Tax=Enterobacter hormaechei TaxID=158836 RepID=A0A855VGE4_9ENTR|nr:hypothetical protein C1O12_25235 [Enterobacter hormaechei]
MATQRNATQRNATQRNATQRRSVSVTNCPHNAVLQLCSDITQGRRGVAPQALPLPPVSPQG